MTRHLVHGSASGRRLLAILAAMLSILMAQQATGLGEEASVWAAALDTPPPVSGRSLSLRSAILPADALARIELVRANVELVRRYVGKPMPPAAVLRVEGAQPREVYFQVSNLHRRATRLAFEQLRAAPSALPSVDGTPTSADVFEVADRALALVLHVKLALGITNVVAEERRPVATTPSEVFNAAVAASNELNTLLEQQATSSEVFRQVTAAIYFAGALHANSRIRQLIPREPPFAPNKTPAEVHERLRRCLGKVRILAAAKKLEMLSFVVPDKSAIHVSPNDVSDLANLVLAEVSFLFDRIGDDRKVPTAYQPGRKFPAHVFQRAGLLELLVDQLVADSASAPASLKDPR